MNGLKKLCSDDVEEKTSFVVEPKSSLATAKETTNGAMAGHADHQITMNTYVHKKNENVAKAGQMMDALLGNYAEAG